MKQITIGLTVFFLLFTACSPQPNPDLSVQSHPEQAASAVAEQDAQTISAALMQDYVHTYETYCGGAEFDTGRPKANMVRNFVFGWAKENDLLDAFAVYQGSHIESYVLASKDAGALCETCFRMDASSQEADLGELRFNADFTELFPTPQLDLESYEQTEEGGWRLVVNRSLEGREYHPAEYLFAPADRPKDEDSPFLKGRNQEMLWQFVSVKNLPMPETASAGQVVKIQTSQDLTDLAQLVNSGDWSYQNNVYLLDADIDMTGVPFSPIGSYTALDPRDPAPKGFCTTFDGQGHTIRNLLVNGGGLFAGIGENGFIANLKLESVVTSAKPETDASGGIAGWITNGSISKCNVSGKVTGSDIAGGIAGLVRNGILQGCRADVAVTGNGTLGGIAGLIEGSSSTLIDCTVTGTVTGQAPYTALGGFAGRFKAGTIDRGIVSVVVSGSAQQDGIGSFIGVTAENSSGYSGNLVGCFYDLDAAGKLPIAGFSEKTPSHTSIIGMTNAQLLKMGAI